MGGRGALAGEVGRGSCKNKGECEEEAQAPQTQKRGLGRDAELGMIINNALRSKNQKNV